MIENRIVCGGAELKIPYNLSFAKYVLDKLKSASPSEIAMINAITQEQMSYGQLVHKITGIAKGLKKMVVKGDVIAMCSENNHEYIPVLIAAVSVGATVTMLSAKYSPGDILHALNISRPKMVFCSESVVDTKIQTILEASFVKHVVQINGRVKKEDVLALEMIMEDNPEEYEPESVNGKEDVAFIFFSSGTTGLPKGVMLTHYNVIYGSEIFTYPNNGERKVVLTVPSWYHVYGLFTSIQYIVNRCLLVYMKELDPKKYLSAIDKYQVTSILAVPPIVSLLSSCPLASEFDLSSVTELWSAAGHLHPRIIENTKKNLKHCKGMYQVYGLTETSLAVFKDPKIHGDKTNGTCGAPLPGIYAKVVDEKSGAKLDANQNGEICIKSPTFMKGYLGNEMATRNCCDDEGYMKTGDLGYYDNYGCFYIVDRLKDIIRYKGEQVSPAMVERVILQHADVAECGVVGAPDEVAGELPTAFVVRTRATLTEQDLIDFTAPKLSPHSRLRGGVIFVDDIPKSHIGKVLRRELRDRLRDYCDKNTNGNL